MGLPFRLLNVQLNLDHRETAVEGISNERSDQSYEKQTPA